MPMSRVSVASSLRGSLPVTDVATEGGKHPSAGIRWVTKGVKLRNGERLHLRAFRSPSGWRTRPEWVEEFLVALTTDARGHDSAPEAQMVRELDQSVESALDALGV
jgi:hypothetical protein